MSTTAGSRHVLAGCESSSKQASNAD